MQHGTRKSVLIPRAIQNILHQWMSQRIGMDADLMRSPRHGLRFDQSRFFDTV